MRQYTAALVSAIVCMIGLMFIRPRAELVDMITTGPTTAIAWTAEAIWAVVFLAVVGSLIFFITSALRAIGLLKLKTLLACAAIVSALLAFLMGYSPPLLSELGLFSLGLYFVPLLITFCLTAICWWAIAKPNTA